MDVVVKPGDLVVPRAYGWFMGTDPVTGELGIHSFRQGDVALVLAISELPKNINFGTKRHYMLLLPINSVNGGLAWYDTGTVTVI